MPTISQNPELDLMSALAEGEESARKGGWVSLEVAMKKLGVLLLLVLCGCFSNRTPTISVTAKINAFYPQAMNEDYTDGSWAAYDAVIFQISSPAQWQGTNLTIYCFAGDTNIIFKTVEDVFQFQIAKDYLEEQPRRLFDGVIEKPKRITEAKKTVELDLTRLDKDGLRGPPDGKVAVSYEFCIPNTDTCKAEVKAIDPTIQLMPGSRGRIGASKDECLCIGTTRKDYRDVLNRLAKLQYIKRIIECHFE